MRKTSERTMPSPMIRLACKSFALTGMLFRAPVFLALFLCLAIHSPAQSATSPVQTPPDQPSAQAGQKDSTAKPSSPAKAKKIITNDDLEPHSAGSGQPGSADKLIVGAYVSLLNCDPACEQQARSELGYDADREAEWQMQIVNARRDLAGDTQWRQTLTQAIQQTNTYCNFLAQRSQKVSPNGNSYNARVQRAQAEQYFQNMDRVLRQGLETITNRMNNSIREVNELSPVRATMMNVQASRILDRECDYSSRQ